MASEKMKRFLDEGAIMIYRGERMIVMQNRKTYNISTPSFIPTDYFQKDGRGRFSVGSRAICFGVDGNVYMTPRLSETIEFLIEEGLIEKYYQIPKISGRSPIKDQKKWEWLCQKAYEKREKDFGAKLKEYLRVKEFGVIGTDILGKCLKIPEEGIRIIFPSSSYWVGENRREAKSFEATYMPAIDFSNDSSVVVENVGTYTHTNGVIAFLHTNGGTYVTREVVVKAALEAAGYQTGPIYPYFSQGETILDIEFQKKWDAMSS